MKNMSTHLESFTKEFHLALEKAIRGDEPKKLKKNKEKRRCEKKEKTKLLGSASTSKTMKDKQTKINETLKGTVSKFLETQAVPLKFFNYFFSFFTPFIVENLALRL